MAGTKLERLEIGGPNVAAFRVCGKLGFHENLKVERLTEECLKRSFERVIFDFSELSSLGGGVAKILRNFVKACEQRNTTVGFVVKNDIVLQFLQDDQKSITIYSSLDDALDGKSGLQHEESEDRNDGLEKEQQQESPLGNVGPAGEEAAGSAGIGTNGKGSDIILMSYDGDFYPEASQGKGDSGKDDAKREVQDNISEDAEQPAGEGGSETGERENGKPENERAGMTEGIFSEIFGEETSDPPPDWIEKPTSPFNDSASQVKVNVGVEELNKQLKRRILELKTLFSISTDFNAIRDRKKLLDIFLLTSIAEGGVESAVFLENKGDSFEPVMAKGIGIRDVEEFKLSAEIKKEIESQSKVICVNELALGTEEKSVFESGSFEYLCPFRQKNALSGLVMLGRRIAGRGMKEEDFEFLRILINIAQGAYENAVMFEREHERTLGIVKTLISLIEENTFIKGASEFVSRYVGMVAKDMEYPEEHFKDLIYGTVLRDMGMIKISDLILRSPRELTKEEWEVIKKHPEDGAEMLRRMKFNNHVVEIVSSHHERFNGEGYPLGLRGKEIPLGSRIISVVESYSAMINERPNRPALSEREALDTLKENYGLRYDREVVMHFAKIMEKEIAKSVRPSISIS